MWSVKFKWLYAIFLVVFTLVMWGGILESVLAPTKSRMSPLEAMFIWVVVFAGVLFWWWHQSKQVKM